MSLRNADEEDGASRMMLSTEVDTDPVDTEPLSEDDSLSDDESITDTEEGDEEEASTLDDEIDEELEEVAGRGSRRGRGGRIERRRGRRDTAWSGRRSRVR